MFIVYILCREILPSPEDLKGKVLVKAKKDKVTKKLADCVNYIHAVSFHKEGFDEAEKSSKCYHMSSFHESKALKFFDDKENSKKFIKYNSRQISRIYPDWNRIDSGNLEPIPAWNTGCQIGRLLKITKNF